MEIEELIISDDIEIATLGTKLYHEKHGQTKLKEILKTNGKYYLSSINKKEVLLRKNIIYVNGTDGEFTFNIPYTL